jgi:hypothetical protein
MILCNYIPGRWQAWENTFSSSFLNQIFRFSSSFHSTKVKGASLWAKLLLYPDINYYVSKQKLCYCLHLLMQLCYIIGNGYVDS